MPNEAHVGNEIEVEREEVIELIDENGSKVFSKVEIVTEIPPS